MADCSSVFRWERDEETNGTNDITIESRQIFI